MIAISSIGWGVPGLLCIIFHLPITGYVITKDGDSFNCFYTPDWQTTAFAVVLGSELLIQLLVTSYLIIHQCLGEDNSKCPHILRTFSFLTNVITFFPSLLSFTGKLDYVTTNWIVVMIDLFECMSGIVFSLLFDWENFSFCSSGNDETMLVKKKTGCDINFNNLKSVSTLPEDDRNDFVYTSMAGVKTDD